MNKSIVIPVIVVSCLGIGFASANLIENLKPKPVNVFPKIAEENKTIRFVKTADSVSAVFPLTIEGEMSFAGEAVPLNDPEVRERLDRELQINAYWQSNTLLSMKLANRYFDQIEKILLEEGVPSDFKYLPLIESGFRDVTSPAGASGFWQFLSGTGKKYGLEINEDVDERYHIEKSTRASCAYLKEAKAKLGSWTLAAASYNMGIEGINSKLQKQHVANYYDLFLTQETSRYVFRMLAMKAIFANPRKAGYMLEDKDLYQPYSYKTISVDSSITDIASFAEANGLLYKHIKMLNTWMRSTSVPNKEKKSYEIKILQ